MSSLEASSFNTSSPSVSSVSSSLYASVPLRTTRPRAFFNQRVRASLTDASVPSSTDVSVLSSSDQPDFVSDSSVVDYAFSWPNSDPNSELQPASASSSEPSSERIAAAAAAASSTFYLLTPYLLLEFYISSTTAVVEEIWNSRTFRRNYIHLQTLLLSYM